MSRFVFSSLIKMSGFGFEVSKFNLQKCSRFGKFFRKFSSHSADLERVILQELSTKFCGDRKVAFTEKLEPIDPGLQTGVPIYRVMDFDGKIIDESQDPELPDEVLMRMYKKMTLLKNLESVLVGAQRQGRITFMMTSAGEEGTHIGSAAALKREDLIFGQYREAGVLLWRGYTPDTLISQCYSNKNDHNHGRAAPLHYGSKELNFVTISSTLSTQMPQAVGAAYIFKLQGSKRVVVCYFGDGAASEGDAHAAFNFAATLKCPIIFFCRNNGYAISTPTTEQYAGDGIAGKGIGYGLMTLRVDGSDVLAVYNAMKKAREIAASNRPVIIEAMTYRLGHHSTSDDSKTYRSKEEVAFWDKVESIKRFKKFLERRGLWSETEDKNRNEELRKTILSEKLPKAEAVKKPSPEKMFEDVYGGKTPERLLEQEKQLKKHVFKNADQYPLEEHEHWYG